MSLYITTLQELIKSYYTFIGLCLFIFCVRLTFDPITPSSLQLVPVTRIRKILSNEGGQPQHKGDGYVSDIGRRQ